METSVEEMVRLYLVKNHYDGLCNPGNCGCTLDSLMPFCEPSGTMCKAAYRFNCERCLDGPEYNNDCELCEYESDFMMSTDIDYCHPMYVRSDE